MDKPWSRRRFATVKQMASWQQILIMPTDITYAQMGFQFQCSAPTASFSAVSSRIKLAHCLVQVQVWLVQLRLLRFPQLQRHQPMITAIETQMFVLTCQTEWSFLYRVPARDILCVRMENQWSVSVLETRPLISQLVLVVKPCVPNQSQEEDWPDRCWQ